MGFYSLVTIGYKGKNRNSGLGQGFGFESWLHLLLFALDNLSLFYTLVKWGYTIY